MPNKGMRRSFFLILMILIPVAGWSLEGSMAAGDQPVRLIAGERESLLVEEYPVSLLPGINHIRYDWPAGVVDPSTLRVTTGAGVSIERTLLAPAGDAIHWEVKSPAGGKSTLSLAWLNRSIDLITEYRARVDTTETSLILIPQRVLRNFSGRDFSHLLIDDLPPVAIADGETRRLAAGQAVTIPFRKLIVWESSMQPWEPQPGVVPPLPIIYRIKRAALPQGEPGKVRFFLTTAAGEERFGGEDRLPDTGVDPELSLSMGASRNLRVTQFLDRGPIENRRPTEGQTLLYDRTESLRTLIENSGDQPAMIELTQTIDGEWEQIAGGDSYRRIGIDRAVIEVEIPANGRREVRFSYQRRNQRGGGR